jgi:hypothetical protein
MLRQFPIEDTQKIKPNYLHSRLSLILRRAYGKSFMVVRESTFFQSCLLNVVETDLTLESFRISQIHVDTNDLRSSLILLAKCFLASQDLFSVIKSFICSREVWKQSIRFSPFFILTRAFMILFIVEFFSRHFIASSNFLTSNASSLGLSNIQ